MLGCPLSMALSTFSAILGTAFLEIFSSGNAHRRIRCCGRGRGVVAGVSVIVVQSCNSQVINSDRPASMLNSLHRDALGDARVYAASLVVLGITSPVKNQRNSDNLPHP